MINLQYADREFRKYLSGFDTENEKIKLKIIHTDEVVRCARDIAERMHLSLEDKKLAELIALLHDIGRFEQIARHDSFAPDTMDHAAYGVELLFGEQKMIRRFLKDDRWDEIIKTAIERHSSFEIGEIEDERTLMHARLIRDADKLDNCRVKLEESLQVLLGTDGETAGSQSITPKVWESCLKRESVLSSDRKNAMDHWVSYVAYFYDIYYPETFEIILEENYVSRVIHRLPYSNPDTAEKMNKLEKMVTRFICKKIRERSSEEMKKILVVGSLNMDFSLHVDHAPKVGETIFGDSVSLIPGGKGANQAYAAGKLGGDVTMFGAVGKDSHGTALLNNLISVDVDTSGVQILPDIPTGQAFVSTYANGDNSIIVIQGANKELTKEMIIQNMHFIEDCDYVVMQMEIPLEVIQYVKDAAVTRGKKVILDPAPASADIPDELWKGLYLIKPNETELEILSGKTCSSREEQIQAAREYVEKGVEHVLVSLGGEGCLLVNASGETFYPAEPVVCVDSTAAGDCFVAALTVALCERKSLDEAIVFAQKAAAVSVTRKGAQTSIPSREEVEQ